MKPYYIILIITFLLGSCASWKEMLVPQGNQNDAIGNAIIDFLHTERLSKEDSVFSVSIDTVSNEILGINILGYEDKLVIHTKNKIGTNHPYFPTNYFERDGKLFYWYDSTNSITDELLNTLSRYNKIDSTYVKGTYELNVVFDDSKKGVDYYFCKNDLTRFKKVRTTIAMGYYDPPKLNCAQSN